MRTTFNNTGSGGWVRPANPPRVRRASWAAIFVLFVMAFLGAVVAAEYEAIYDEEARGEMDGE